MGARHVILDKVIEHRHSYKFRVEIFFVRQNSHDNRHAKFCSYIRQN
jgi:hypothetical protein